MSVVQSMSGLAQGAEQITRNEDNAEHQQSFVKPARHAAAYAGCQIRCLAGRYIGCSICAASDLAHACYAVLTSGVSVGV